MSGDLLDGAIHAEQCLNGVVGAEGRQFHYAATVRPLSIAKRWCTACREYHWYEIQRTLATRPSLFARHAGHLTQKARSVALLVLLGELLGLAALGIGASALAAMQ